MTTPTPSEARQVAVLERLSDACLSRRLTPAECGEFYEAIRALRQGGEVDDEARRKARCWDDLLAARDAARKAPDDSEWKRLARSGETMAAIKACRAAHGFSLTEARNCVEIYALPPPPAEGEAA